MRKLLLVASVLVAASCSEQVKVNVNCVTVATPAVECDVTQTLGKAEVEVCWDFEVKCANGNMVHADRTCQKVSGGGTEKAVIPADKLHGLDECGGSGPPTGAVKNLTINGKSSS